MSAALGLGERNTAMKQVHVQGKKTNPQKSRANGGNIWPRGHRRADGNHSVPSDGKWKSEDQQIYAPFSGGMTSFGKKRKE